MFKSEARVAMELVHRHIVRLYNFEAHEGVFFLVMEHVDGSSIRGLLQLHTRFELAFVSQVVGVVAAAMDYAHRHGIVHRDLKPDNLLLADDGVLKVIDFGLAGIAGRNHGPDRIVGTPAYMSPEQKTGDHVDERTDIYALGIIAYELLTGTVPFPVDVSHEQVLSTTAGDLVGVDDEIRDVLERATAEDSNSRWSAMSDFAEAFGGAAARIAGKGTPLVTPALPRG